MVIVQYYQLWAEISMIISFEWAEISGPKSGWAEVPMQSHSHAAYRVNGILALLVKAIR